MTKPAEDVDKILQKLKLKELKKVWVVIEDDGAYGEVETILAIFTTEEKAKDFVREYEEDKTIWKMGSVYYYEYETY